MKGFIGEGESTSILDFGIHGTFTQDDMAGVDISIPALIKMAIVSFKGFTAYKKRWMKLELVKMTSENPAKIFGL